MTKLSPQQLQDFHAGMLAASEGGDTSEWRAWHKTAHAVNAAMEIHVAVLVMPVVAAGAAIWKARGQITYERIKGDERFGIQGLATKAIVKDVTFGDALLTWQEFPDGGINVYVNKDQAEALGLTEHDAKSELCRLSGVGT